VDDGLGYCVGSEMEMEGEVQWANGRVAGVIQ
jgi:hypothetical protein